MNRSWMGTAFAIAFLGACGGETTTATSGAGELELQGTVSQSLELDNARAVAEGSDGRTFWAYLDADRDFTLRLPVGQSYRLSIANGRAGGGTVPVADLAIEHEFGTTAWIGANEPGTVDLGTLLTETETEAGDLATQCASCKKRRSGAHHGDNPRCREKHGHDRDDDDRCKKARKVRRVHPSRHPGKKCEDRRRHQDHPICTDGGVVLDGGTSTDAGGGGGGGVGSECNLPTDCALGLSCLAGICRAPSTDGGVGSECLINADCAPNLVCVAGQCTSPL